MNRICPGAGDDVDGAARGSAGLRREAVIDDLKFLDDFGRKLGATRTRVLVVVIEAIDRDIVAAWPEPAEGESAASNRG